MDLAKVKEVQAFLGFCNFYRHFVKDYSTIARPLFNLTMKDTPFVWGPSQQSAFTTLLMAFTSALVLALLDHDKPFRLITDTSDFTTGAILEQPDALNHWHPVAYHSKALLPAERNYEIHDKELLAIIRALETFCHYLEGRLDTLEIWTDHSNLVYFTKKQKLSYRQARWALYLTRFTFTIIHKLGAFNKSNALSQRPDYKEGLAHDNEDRVLLDTKFFAVRATWPAVVSIQGDTTLHNRIKAAQTYDTEVSKALETILKNGPRSVSKGLED